MGMSATAQVVYGVDLGNPYDDFHVEYPKEWDEEGLSEVLGDIAAEFVGWTEQWSDGNADYFTRRHDFMKDKVVPEIVHYGYEYSGITIATAQSLRVYGSGPKPLHDVMSECDPETHTRVLEEFLDFLEGKGLVFIDEGKREPQWLLLASYG